MISFRIFRLPFNARVAVRAIRYVPIDEAPRIPAGDARRPAQVPGRMIGNVGQPAARQIYLSPIGERAAWAIYEMTLDADRRIPTFTKLSSGHPSLAKLVPDALSIFETELQPSSAEDHADAGRRRPRAVAVGSRRRDIRQARDDGRACHTCAPRRNGSTGLVLQVLVWSGRLPGRELATLPDRHAPQPDRGNVQSAAHH
jgi:hypothetical protein